MNFFKEIALAWRQTRGQASKAWLFLFCVAIGISGRVSVDSFMARLDDAIRRDARSLLTADMEVSSQQPFSPQRLAQLQSVLPAESEVIDRVSLLTMGGSAGRSRLVMLSAVSPGFPLFGEYEIRSAAGPAEMDILFGKPKAVVGRTLLSQLGVQLGDTLRLGQAEFEIAGVLEKEPGLGASAFSLGPRVLISQEFLADTRLTGFGSRTTYELLIGLPNASEAPKVAPKIREAWDLGSAEGRSRGVVNRREGIQVRTYEDAQGEIRMFFGRLADFLNLVSLFALMLGGVGVASVTRGFVAEQAPAIATYRVLGATGMVMTRVYFYQCLGLGFLGGLLGAVLGSAAQAALPWVLGPFLPVAISSAPVPQAILWGPLLGLAVAGMFSLLPVSEILSTRPAELYRKGLEGAKAPWFAWVLAGLGAAGLTVLASVDANSVSRGLMFMGSLVLAAAVLWVTAKFILPWVPRLRHLMPGFGARFGLSNLARSGRRSAASVVALGCAATLLGVLAVYQRSLLWELDPRKKADAVPGLFMIDIQDDQVAAMHQTMKATPAKSYSLSPMVKARYRGVVGKGDSLEVDQWGREGESAKAMRSREQNLSYREEMGVGEKLVAGRWLDPNADHVEASLEKWFAQRLDVTVGDNLLFDVQGVLVQAELVGLREVHWASFQPNFFVLLSPWALQGAPKTWIGSANGLNQKDREEVLDLLSVNYPNVTMIDVAEGAERLMGIMARMAWAIQFVAVFSLIAGLVVLAGIALANARERRAESALLMALGGRRRTLVAAVAAEFGALGAIAALVGIALSVGFGWGLVTYIVKIPFVAPWMELGVLAAAMIVLCALTGALVCWRVFNVKPLETLREE